MRWGSGLPQGETRKDRHKDARVAYRRNQRWLCRENNQQLLWKGAKKEKKKKEKGKGPWFGLFCLWNTLESHVTARLISHPAAVFAATKMPKPTTLALTGGGELLYRYGDGNGRLARGCAAVV